MRPVNLLPPKHRPRTVEERTGSGYLLLGALGLLLLATLGYVLFANEATSRKDQTVQVTAEAEQAEAHASALKPFAQFAELKQTREASVRQLAQQRFDWERSMRELSRLLPAHVWLSSLEASTTGAEAASSPGAASAAPASGPSLKISGCARSQPDVAATLVRLRALYKAADVNLSDSSKGGSASGASASSGSTPASTGAANCTDYTFNATIDFGAGSGQEGAGKAPASLGGGA